VKAANLSLVTTRTNWIHSWAGCIFNKDRLTSSIITHLCEMAIWNRRPACSSHRGIAIGFIHAFGERPRFPSSCFLRIRNFMLVLHCFLFAKLACYYHGDVLVCDREIWPMWFVKTLLQNLFCSNTTWAASCIVSCAILTPQIVRVQEWLCVEFF
jgi:hypothetical protein